jgi:hypothetical protein
MKEVRENKREARKEMSSPYSVSGLYQGKRNELDAGENATPESFADHTRRISREYRDSNSRSKQKDLGEKRSDKQRETETENEDYHSLTRYEKAFKKGRDLLRKETGKRIDFTQTKHFEQRYKENYTSYGNGIYGVKIHLRGDISEESVYEGIINTRERVMETTYRYRSLDDNIWKEKGLQATSPEANKSLPGSEILLRFYHEACRREGITKPEALKMILFRGIDNKETIGILSHMVKPDTEVSLGKGHYNYYTAMGTPNGKSCAYILCDHYPTREISKIEIYSYPSGEMMDMHVYFDDKKS